MKKKRQHFGDQWIPFYGGDNPEFFALERKAMDRAGKVTARLDELVPSGVVADIGAGDGFMAEKLTRPDRTVIAVEPDPLMVDREKKLPWLHGVAQSLPFHDATLDGVYATWAFFFSGSKEADKGLAEAKRVVRPGGSMVFVDNAGDDEFSSFSPRKMGSDPQWWADRGFTSEIVETSFHFDSVDDAKRLFTFFFGAEGMEVDKEEIGYRVAVYSVR